MSEFFKGCLYKCVILVLIVIVAYFGFVAPPAADGWLSSCLAIPLLFLIGGGMVWVGFRMLGMETPPCEECGGTGQGNALTTDEYGNNVYVCPKCRGIKPDAKGNLLGCALFAGIGGVVLLYGLNRVGNLIYGPEPPEPTIERPATEEKPMPVPAPSAPVEPAASRPSTMPPTENAPALPPPSDNRPTPDSALPPPAKPVETPPSLSPGDAPNSAALREQAIDAAKWRTWTSAQGKFSTEAKFIQFSNGKVLLERKDGKQLTLSLDQLSPTDQDFIKNRRWLEAGKNAP